MAEATAVVLLLRNHRAGGRLAVMVAAVWTGLSVAAFAQRLPLDNCGCFGVHLGQPLRWWVLLEDAGFVALAAPHTSTASNAEGAGRPTNGDRPPPSWNS